MNLPALAALAAAVAARLGINEAVVADRLNTFVKHLAEAISADVFAAAKMIAARGTEDVSKLLAHGPTEQVRASLAPEVIEPPESAKAGLGGQLPVAAAPAGEPETTASGSVEATKEAAAAADAETAEKAPSKTPDSSAGA